LEKLYDLGKTGQGGALPLQSLNLCFDVGDAKLISSTGGVLSVLEYLSDNILGHLGIESLGEQGVKDGVSIVRVRGCCSRNSI